MADASSQRSKLLVLRVRFDQVGHLNRLRMMHDHSLHELHICRELGGSVALVDGGKVRLGLPGAPGCTTTGVGAGSCPQTDSENNPKRAVASTIPGRNTATRITVQSLRLHSQ